MWGRVRDTARRSAAATARALTHAQHTPFVFLRSYEGAFVDEQRHGQGQQLYADGSIYRGEWVGDKRHGMGELVQPTGDMYRGAWEADEKHGEGSYVFAAKGRVLHGEWVRGMGVAGEMRPNEGLGGGEGAMLPELGLANAECVRGGLRDPFPAARFLRPFTLTLPPHPLPYYAHARSH